MKNSIQFVLEKIKKTDDLKKNFLKVKSLEDIYDFLLKNGYEGTEENFKTEFFKIITSENKISDDDLALVSGGTLGSTSKKIQVSLLAALALGTPLGFLGASDTAYGLRNVSTVSQQIANPENSNAQKTIEIINYFTDEKISDAQKKAYEITNKLSKYLYTHVSTFKEISSLRKDKNKYTDLEKMLDKFVDKGDLPIKSFYINDINLAKDSLKPGSDKNPKYIIANLYDVLNLHETNLSTDGEIVQLASQFNAMESTSTDFTPVKYWFYDKTQGPLGSLQSTAACKHKEAAFLKGKVQDSIQELLESCTVSDGKKDIPILELYPDLYKGGYFAIQVVGGKNREHLKILDDFIKNNIGKLKFNSQWVLCEGTHRKQLHVFNAAPVFQLKYGYIDWSQDFENKDLYKSICTQIVNAQYKALAQIAAIRSVQTGKPSTMHVYQIGQGAFYNPPEVMDEVLKTIDKELKGFDVNVILHQWKNPKYSWDKIAANSNIKIYKNLTANAK